MDVSTVRPNRRSNTQINRSPIPDLVLVSVTARFTLPGGGTRVTTVEERVPLSDILVASDLVTAMGHFLSRCDVALGAADVTSLMVNGHELIHTFKDQRRPRHPEDGHIF